MASKERADVLLAAKGIFNSRTQAQRAIMAGLVTDHNHQRIDKAGEKFPLTRNFSLKRIKLKYVSPGRFQIGKGGQGLEH